MKYGIKMADIAKEFNVSVVTVSNALSGRGGVSPALAQEIAKRAAALGYRPSVPRKPRKHTPERAMEQPKYTVGILTSENFGGDKGTFYWELAQHLTKALRAVPLHVLSEKLTLQEEREHVCPGLITEKHVDAVVVLGQLKHDYLDFLIEQQTPLVFLDFYDDHNHIDSVVSDSYYGGYLLTDYLIGLGHEKIGFIGSVTATSSIHDRFMGYLKAMMEHSLPYERKWTLADREGVSVMMRDFNFPEELPTAFVCNCDETAFLVINALKRMGKRVPDDISVVGYDNYMVSDMCVPSITTVEVDIALMASATADIVRKKLAHPGYCEGKRIIPAKLLEKNSVAAIAK